MKTTPITVTPRVTTNFTSENGIPTAGGYNGYGNVAPIGYGNYGVNDLDRITMSIKSGLESEVEWALSNLTRISTQNGFQLERNVYIGQELIRYMNQMFEEEINAQIVNLGLDALLTLRNLAQELENQHWLLQYATFKKNLVDIMRFWNNWFFEGTFQPSFKLKQFEAQFLEAFGYVLDILDPLSCYYIDNSKNDPLFNIVLSIAMKTNDKAIFISTLNCVSHLLIVSDDDKDEEEHDNCISLISDRHLEYFVSKLLVDDDDIKMCALEFIKQYLFSTALISENETIENSQQYRLNKLLQIDGTCSNLASLMKELPLILCYSIPKLKKPQTLAPAPQTKLTRRGNTASTDPPELTDELYDVIRQYQEPLRATTWLRCCYEPCNHGANADPDSQGEVTQLSLWKAYEKQFHRVWESEDKTAVPLLRAVDFIKNVSNAFPNSEIMVINLPVTEEEEPKQKFIIKGIQPRPFVASIDVGNQEASMGISEPLPVGHVNGEEFNAAIFANNEDITKNKIQKDGLNQLTVCSGQILDYILTQMLDKKQNEEVKRYFGLYNGYWLPEVIYANPSLLSLGLVKSGWLRYI